MKGQNMNQVTGEAIASSGHLISQAKQSMQLRPQTSVPSLPKLMFRVGQSFTHTPQALHSLRSTRKSLLSRCRTLTTLGERGTVKLQREREHTGHRKLGMAVVRQWGQHAQSVGDRT